VTEVWVTEKLSARCPFCGGELDVIKAARAACEQVVDIRARCLACREQIHAAGIGEASAIAAFEALVERRKGRSPEEFRIQARGAPTRRRRVG
jgi:hypothetical protein